MTRSSRKKLVKTFKEPEKAFYSIRKLFRTPSLDHSAPPGFELFFDYEDQFEEEITETMTETMEEYMTKTREEYGSGKFLSKYCPPARTAKKMEEINKFQQEPDETLHQAWERFKELLLRCPQHYLTNMQELIMYYKGLDVPTRQILDSKGDVPKISAVDAKKAIQEMADNSQKWHDGAFTRNRIGCEVCNGAHYTKDCPLKEEGKTLEEAYYTQFGVPFPQAARYRAVGPGFHQRDNGNPSYQEQRQMMEELLSKFMAESEIRHDENSNLGKGENIPVKKLKRPRYAILDPTDTRLREYGDDVTKVSKKLDELQVNSTESGTSLERLLKEK
ncbi:hypothetical protein Tco_1219383 [Tanacetum coccineum]